MGAELVGKLQLVITKNMHIRYSVLVVHKKS